VTRRGDDLDRDVRHDFRKRDRTIHYRENIDEALVELIVRVSLHSRSDRERHGIPAINTMRRMEDNTRRIVPPKFRSDAGIARLNVTHRFPPDDARWVFIEPGQNPPFAR
jgi:hypothetical protein